MWPGPLEAVPTGIPVMAGLAAANQVGAPGAISYPEDIENHQLFQSPEFQDYSYL